MAARLVARSAVGLLLATTLAACVGGERLAGPTITVRNDLDRAIVVGEFRSKWEVPAGTSRFLERLPMTAFTNPPSLQIVDSTTCETVASVSLSFQTSADPLVIIPATGAPESRAMTAAERQAQALEPSAVSAPNSCVGPADGWSLLVVSRAERAYALTMTEPDRGGAVAPRRVIFDVSPRATGSIVWSGWVGETTAGSIELLDPTTCEVLGTVDHGPWGTFVVAIDESAHLTIVPGAIPADAAPLPGRAPRTIVSVCEPGGSG